MASSVASRVSGYFGRVTAIARQTNWRETVMGGRETKGEIKGEIKAAGRQTKMQSPPGPVEV